MQMTLSHQQPIDELQEDVGVASIKHRVWGNFTVAEDTVNYSTYPLPFPNLPTARHVRLWKSYEYYKTPN